MGEVIQAKRQDVGVVERELGGVEGEEGEEDNCKSEEEVGEAENFRGDFNHGGSKGTEEHGGGLGVG
jgi:hypothetical protein